MAEVSEERRREVEERNARNFPLIEQYRSNGGIADNPRLLLLHHEGAQSGTARINPLAFRPVGDNFAVFASNAGRAKHPDWFHNVVAHPSTTIEVGPETINVVARVATGDERAAIWDAQKADQQTFADYEKTAAPREIPVVLLERA